MRETVDYSRRCQSVEKNARETEKVNRASVALGGRDGG